MLENLLSAFPAVHEVRHIAPVAGGHIHRSFRVEARSGPFFLQQINHRVFPGVAAVMHNIRRVTDFLHDKYQDRDDVETLRLFRTDTGADFYSHPDGTHWRLYDFKPALRSYETPPTDAHCRRVGRAYANFTVDLRDFPPEQLRVPLPKFHDVTHRYTQFSEARTHDVAHRLKDCADLVDFVDRHWQHHLAIDRGIAAGALPLRIVHNDAKLSNVLLQPFGRRHCVVDLDTVMPGCWLHDYGDGIRSLLGPEDQEHAPTGPDLRARTARLTAFSQTYQAHIRPIATEAEVALIPRARALLPFLMGMRFLTDFLNGDVYYHTEYALQNLRRARTQLRWSDWFTR